MHLATASEPYSGRNKSHSEFIDMLLYLWMWSYNVGHSMTVADDEEPGTKSWFNGSEQIWLRYWQIEQCHYVG